MPSASSELSLAALADGARDDSDRLPALDGWRGVAVALVLVGHLWPRLLPGGFVGVSVFFALSGYLITSLLLREADGAGNRISLGGFWRRRIRRLAPMALIVLVLSLFATRIWPQASGGIREFVAAATHWLNLHYVAEGAKYGQDTSDPSAIQHYWSLAIEEQFYVIFPLLAAGAAWAARKRGWSLRLVLAVPLAMAAGLSIGLGQLVTPGTAYYRTELRMGEIAIGCFAALCFPLEWRRGSTEDLVDEGLHGTGGSASADIGWSSWAADAVGALGLGIVLGSSLVMTVDEPRLYSSGFSVIALATVMVMWSLPRGRYMAAALAASPLAWTGRVSYGLYLLHWPLLVFAHRALPDIDESVRAVGVLIVTFVLAALSYRFVEMPIRRGRLTTRPVLAYAGALVVVATTVIFVPPSANSFDFPAQLTDSVSASDRVPAGAIKAVALGDSVLWSAMSSMQSDDDVYLMRALIPGCPFLPNVDGLTGRQGSDPILADSDVCTGWRDTMAGFAALGPDLILFSTGYSMAAARVESGGDACDARFEDWYAPRLKATVASLVRVAPVVAVVPHRSYVPTFFQDRGLTDNREMMLCIRRIQEDVFADTPGVRSIDMDSYLCPNGVDGCKPTELEDGIHFNKRKTAGVQAWLKRIIVDEET